MKATNPEEGIMPSSETVPVGLGTKVGLAAALAQFLAAIAAFIVAWQSKDSTLIFGAVAPAVTGGVTLATVLAGRYAQAKEEIKQAGSDPLAVAGAVAGELSQLSADVREALEATRTPVQVKTGLRLDSQELARAIGKPASYVQTTELDAPPVPDEDVSGLERFDGEVVDDPDAIRYTTGSEDDPADVSEPDIYNPEQDPEAVKDEEETR